MFDNSKIAMEKIFGVKKIEEAPKGMHLLFDVTETGRTRQQIYRNENGQYYLTAEVAEGAEDEDEMKIEWAGSYTFEGHIIMPISREGAVEWSWKRLWGSEMEAALKEFGYHDDSEHPIWRSHEITNTDPAVLHEWLVKIDEKDFVLYSTDDSYPLCHGDTVVVEMDYDDIVFEVYYYFIPAETARRWAKANNMNPHTWENFFGSSEK